MANEDKNKKSFADRIKDGLRDAADGWLETLEGLLRPAPEPVLIPVRRPMRRYR